MNDVFTPHVAAINAIDFHGCCLTRQSISSLLEILEAKQKEGVPLSVCALNLSGKRWREG